MNTKSLALILFDLPEARWLLPKAASLARGLDAHLTVLHAYRPVFYYDIIGPEPMIYATIDHWREDASDPIRQIFEAEVKANDILADYREHAVIGGAEPFLLAAGRTADFVIFGTDAAPNRAPDDRSLMERLVRQLGRPALVLHPDSAIQAPFQRLVIGWSDTREAARAAHDAIAVAADGAQIQIVTIVSDPEDSMAMTDQQGDLAAALNRRGFAVTVNERHASAPSRAAALLGACKDFGGDVIVAGAFGHSRVYDFVIGAVTRELLATSQYPLVLSR